MKINRIENQMLNTNQYKAKEKNPSEKEINTKNSVDIQISSSAKELVQSISESKDSIYSEKVEKIRQSVMDGSYKVNSEAVADKILQTIKAQKDSDILWLLYRS